MNKDGNILILDSEITDDMLSDFIEAIKDEDIEIIQIDTDNISSLCLQQLFCIAKEKKIEVNNIFIAKFFENINYID